MIDENLCRAEPSPADRAKQTARRKAIYLELHPETAHGANLEGAGVAKLSTPDVPAFSAATATMTGQSERVVCRDAERGEKVIDAAIDVIRGTVLDTGTYLDKLKKLSLSDQVYAAKRDLNSHRTNSCATCGRAQGGTHTRHEGNRMANFQWGGYGMRFVIALLTSQFPLVVGDVPITIRPELLAQSYECSPRRTCKQILTCEEARWYLDNCAWGGRLDRDNDGRPCEGLC